MISFDIDNPAIAAWIAFGQTRRIVERLVDKTFTATALKSEEYEVLLVLNTFPGVPGQRDIVTWLGRSPSAISELLTRMATAGLITQERDPNDRRVVRVRATDEGMRRFWEVSPGAWEMVSGALASLSEDELRRLTMLLQKMRTGVARQALEDEEPGFERVAIDDAARLAELERRMAAGHSGNSGLQ